MTSSPKYGVGLRGKVSHALSELLVGLWMETEQILKECRIGRCDSITIAIPIANFACKVESRFLGGKLPFADCDWFRHTY
jgi:hypothetical protein